MLSAQKFVNAVTSSLNKIAKESGYKNFIEMCNTPEIIESRRKQTECILRNKKPCRCIGEHV